MSPERKPFDDRLKDYVEVKERVRQFYERWPEGRLVTIQVNATSEPDGKPRVWVEAAAYRTADDPLPARGWSWMELPGTTPYTRGSELENTETSAWGRAIAALNIGITASIASSNEIASKSVTDEADFHADGDPGGLIGTAEVGKTGSSDFELRQEATRGHVLSFRLVSGRSGMKVIAFDPLASALHAVKADVLGKRVTCWGSISDESFDKTVAGKKQTITYKVLTLERIQTPDFTLPAVDATAPWTPDELADLDPVPLAPGQEAMALT